MSFLRKEPFLLLAALAAILAYAVEHAVLAMGQEASLAAAGLVVTAIILVALRVAHHAEVLAEKLGEPYGSMLLTTAAVTVEVVILAIMLSHNPSPTLVRDTIYSAMMIDMNGIIGVAALLGGLKHGEQKYNLDTGNSYLVMILTAIGIAMVVPTFAPVAVHETWLMFAIVTTAILYALFVKMQTGRHSYFFNYNYAETGDETGHSHPGDTRTSVILLLTGLTLIGALAEVMAKFLDTGLQGTGVPAIIPGVIVALISASPEIMTAIRAALANRMQPVLNIALGATLATVVLTVPLIGLFAIFTDHPLDLTLTPTQMAMAGITIVAAAINLNDGETNAIEGMTHFVLFLAFVMLAVLGM